MNGSQTATLDELRLEADAFVAKKTTDTKRAHKLEKQLAKAAVKQAHQDGRAEPYEEDEARVQGVRKLRQELDVDDAVKVLADSENPERPERLEPEQLLELGKRLAEYREMGLARRVLMLACSKITEMQQVPPEIWGKIFQKAALYTYKDPDLPLDWKLDRAYELIGKAEPPRGDRTDCLADTVDPETLGIAGAIRKRKWEVDGQRQNLESALYFYLKGYAQGAPDPAARADVIGYLRAHPGCELNAEKDQGYTGINAAFVLDLLAAQEEEEARQVGLGARTADERRAAARLIREEIVRSVPPLIDQSGNEWLVDQWWSYSTIGEALFGLGRYGEAEDWLIKRPKNAGLRVGFNVRSSAGLQVPEWEYESTARQLGRLGRLQCEVARARAGTPGKMSEEEFEQTGTGRFLKEFLGGEHRALASAYRGKIGLGLSGGGFRASFFHIGVLARLAEIGVLSQVEVLSCVSGGSIIGAHYYLELRRVLQTTLDGRLDSSDYVKIVKKVETDFLAGVQRNIRTRVLAELGTNLKMIFSARYSRTLRVGELYERELYSRVEDGDDGKSPWQGPRLLPDWLARPFGFKRPKRLLKDLRIFPRTDKDGELTKDEEFNPTHDNWRRENKVPVLVLNACSLNTGHNWQFTTTYMGEPPLPIQAGIDTNFRLRRFYFDPKKGPPPAPPVTLGQAVGASSCVPGLFEPLRLDGLYTDDPKKRRISVRLVDGGVCDNQGIASLLEQDCSVMLISDGSGQMDGQDAPSTGLLGVLTRSDAIFQARVREAQYTDAATRRRAQLLRGFMFVHLKQELAGEALAWQRCPDDQKKSEVYDWRFDPVADKDGVTSYGVARDIQTKLAAVRTDLDSFSDAEAYALMASGYRMTEQQFLGPNPPVRPLPDADVVRGDWRFRAIESALNTKEYDKVLGKLLDASRSPAFKIWQLSPVLIAVKWILALAAVAGVIGLFIDRWGQPLVPEAAQAWLRDGLTFETVGTWALGMIALAALAAIANAILGKWRGEQVMRLIRWRDTLKHIAIGVGMSTVGWLIARLHLHLFDRWYLNYGRLKGVPKAVAAPNGGAASPEAVAPVSVAGFPAP